MKNRPDPLIMHGGVGPSALGTLCGNMLHGEVSGDSENQTRTAFVHVFFFPSTFFRLSLPFHRVLAAFPELQWAGLSGYVFTCESVLPTLLLAGDPCLCDLLFYSCSGRKGETSCLAAAHMDYENSGMRFVKSLTWLWNRVSLQLAFHCYNIIKPCCRVLHIKLNAFLTSLVINSCSCAWFGIFKRCINAAGGLFQI